MLKTKDYKKGNFALFILKNYKMKKFVCIIFLVIISCKSFKDYSSQEVILKENKYQSFTLDNNEMIIDLTINDKKGKFLLDFGAMTSVITDSIYLNSLILNQDNYSSSRKITGASGIEINSNKYISDSINSSIINGKKYIFKHLVIKNPNNISQISCNEIDQKKVGIIGFDVFKNAAQPILLDFEKNVIKVLNQNYSIEGYLLMNAKIPTFVGSKLTIPFLVEGENIDFLFDTGNNGSFFIKEDQNKIPSSKIKQVFETYMGTVGNISIEKITNYDNVNIKHENIIDISTKLSSFPKLINNTVGIAFIKNYNWILDFKNGNVYCKKINNNNLDEVQQKSIVSGVLDNKLLVVYKNISVQNKLSVGDQITSVKNIKVTLENICELNKLLNKTEDWSGLSIVIKK